MFNYVIPMENKSFFAIYSTGVTEYEYDNLINSKNLPEGENYGYYFDGIQSKGYNMKLPMNVKDRLFWEQRVLYLGEDKFLIVSDNKIERDFYIGNVFTLKKKK